MTVAETIEKIATVKEGVEKEKLIIISLIANHNEKKKKKSWRYFYLSIARRLHARAWR